MPLTHSTLQYDQCVDRTTDVRAGMLMVKLPVSAKLYSGEHKMMDTFIV
jgi:hypothetical protein